MFPTFGKALQYPRVQQASSTQEVLILLKQMSRDAKIFYIKSISYLQNLMPVLHNELIK